MSKVDWPLRVGYIFPRREFIQLIRHMRARRYEGIFLDQDGIYLIERLLEECRECGDDACAEQHLWIADLAQQALDEERTYQERLKNW